MPSEHIPLPFVHRHLDRIGWLIAAIVLTAAFLLHLIPALFAGLLVHELVGMLAPRLHLSRFKRNTSKLLAVGVLATLVVAIVIGVFSAVFVFALAEMENINALLGKMADALLQLRVMLPLKIQPLIPQYSPVDLGARLLTILRDNAALLPEVGSVVGTVVVQLIFGLIIGFLVSIREAVVTPATQPLAAALCDRTARLGRAFREVVFAQVRISLINTGLTAIYLVVALPLFDVHMPLVKTMIAVTFIAGLIPVIGNLISNTVIVAVSLHYSPHVALASLGYLVFIHKLEYFINARIIGGRINAAAWELLLAMLVMERAFGVIGLIAAPVYYAYLKRALMDYKLI